ncbi:MAG: RecB family exonuclease [Oceanicoccus sp.]|jgi:RecB family exonuclease
MAKKNYLRSQNKFNPHSEKPYRLSRSKVDLFINCPRCFYLDRRCGLRRPGRVSYNLNNAVDLLLKREFDHYRQSVTAHPLMNQNGVEAVPYQHADLDLWREALRGGLRHHHKKTNFLLTGAPDDLWVNPNGELSVVDYKATRVLSQASLDSGQHPGYQRQLEFYSWLLEKMNFPVSKQTYFVVAETRLNREALNHSLEFDLNLIRYESDWQWVEAILPEIKECLMSEDEPEAGETCDYCRYVEAGEVLKREPKQGTLL